MISASHHVGIIVSNLERSLAFYRDVLGCKFMFDGGPYRNIEKEVAVPNAEVKTAHLEIGGFEIELVEYTKPRIKLEGLCNAAIGTSHFAFEVDDIYAEYDRLKKKGVMFNAPPLLILEGGKKGQIWTYFRDPDGYTLELVQKAKSP